MTAYEEEDLEQDVPPLDPNLSDAELACRIAGLAFDLGVLANGIRTGPRDMSQLVALDDLADALDAAMRMEDARKIPPAEGDG